MPTTLTPSPIETPIVQKPTKARSVKLIAAPFTPLNADGSINFGLIEKYADTLVENGVAGVFINGTTGEGLSHSREDRIALAEAWRSATRSKLTFIVHVGHSSIEESKLLAAHAESIGADGIASIGSIFFEPSDLSAWVLACRAIASAAPHTPFYYYHMPSMSRVRFKASDILPALIESIPNFRGIKFTHDDLEDYQRCLSLAAGKYEIFFGRDELLLEGLTRGATSAVGSTYNFAAPLYLRLAEWHRLGRTEDATATQTLCTNGIEIMIRNGGLPAIRATMGLNGIDCGPMRLPLLAPSAERIQILWNELQEMGYFHQLQRAKANSHLPPRE